ncbi:mechanosensitive ion channel family protein [Cerasicoccus fimbriatus]|uniref:mechanosensitive ion channel family protein n=1 Tax=Cerasicoccus fimbriatus TaxID=3014554 RepID=UPI0022B531FE|nr:mechanosensitive ion channel family protein [Cerasicoccus sp. TK19100]
MRKLFSFVLLVATAIAWFSVVAPAQETTVARELEAKQESAPADSADEKPAPAEAAATKESTEAQHPTPVDEAATLVGETASDLGDSLRTSVLDIAHDAVDATGFRSEISTFLNFKIGSFRMKDLALSFFILLVAMMMRNFLTRVFFKRLQAMARKTAFEHDDELLKVLEKPFSLFLLALGIYLAILALPLSSMLEGLVGDLFRGLTMVLAVWGMLRATDIFTNIFSNQLAARNSALHGFVPTINKSLKIFIVIVGVLLVIDNLGYNVGGILATLGLGGAAIAFASQDTIKNLFGTFMIMLDRPFKVGDWIMVGDKVDGDVEEIGLRSTKVRTWPKTVISIPNGVLANEYINNWTRMPKRRVKQVIGITYEATAEDMEALVQDIRQILGNDEGVNQEFILVNFTDFGSSSLDILVYYFTLSTKWLEYMDVRQRVNCKIMRAIHKRGLSVAFPTRTLYLDGQVARHMAQVDYEDRWETQPGRGAMGGGRPADTGIDPNRPPGQLGGGNDGDGRLPGDYGSQFPQ